MILYHTKILLKVQFLLILWQLCHLLRDQSEVLLFRGLVQMLCYYIIVSFQSKSSLLVVRFHSNDVFSNINPGPQTWEEHQPCHT